MHRLIHFTHPRFIKILCLCLFIFCFTNAHSAMRCQGKLFDIGDDSDAIEKYCGSPLSKKEYTEKSQSFDQFGRIVNSSVTYERWIYQRSSVDLRYYLLFQGGILKKMYYRGRR